MRIMVIIVTSVITMWSCTRSHCETCQPRVLPTLRRSGMCLTAISADAWFVPSFPRLHKDLNSNSVLRRASCTQLFDRQMSDLPAPTCPRICDVSVVIWQQLTQCRKTRPHLKTGRPALGWQRCNPAYRPREKYYTKNSSRQRPTRQDKRLLVDRCQNSSCTTSCGLCPHSLYMSGIHRGPDWESNNNIIQNCGWMHPCRCHHSSMAGSRETLHERIPYVTNQPTWRTKIERLPCTLTLNILRDSPDHAACLLGVLF